MVDRLSVVCNGKVLTSNSSIFNQKSHDTIFNSVMELLVDAEKIQISFKLTTPDDPNDESYRREFFRTSVDAQKLLNGLNGNYVTKTIMENVMKTLDVKPKFPVKKVINQNKF